jgi:hypothetical protein
LLIEHGARIAVAADDLDRIVHHLLYVEWGLRRRAEKLGHRHAAIPHRPMRRAVDRLILRGK